jgi:hypothetical protein
LVVGVYTGAFLGVLVAEDVDSFVYAVVV